MSDVISIFAYISTIVFCLSHANLIYIAKVKEKEGIKTTSFTPMISCLMSQLIWFIYYRIRISDNNICWCYLTGASLSFILAIVYSYFYSREYQKNILVYFVLYILIFADLVFEIVFLERDLLTYKDKNHVNKGVILFACFLNLLMYIIPGSNICKMFKELDPNYLSFPISVCGILNSLIWLLYGIRNDDNKKAYIYTNIIAMIICLLQILFYFTFKNNAKLIKKTEGTVFEQMTTGSKKKRKKSRIKSSSSDSTKKEEAKEDMLDII